MEFEIYFNYEITVKNKYSYINEDGDHTTEKENFKKIIDGGKLGELIADFLKDRLFSYVSIKNDKIKIKMFDPMDGTGQSILITIREIKPNETNA